MSDAESSAEEDWEDEWLMSDTSQYRLEDLQRVKCECHLKQNIEAYFYPDDQMLTMMDTCPEMPRRWSTGAKQAYRKLLKNGSKLFLKTEADKRLVHIRINTLQDWGEIPQE